MRIFALTVAIALLTMQSTAVAANRGGVMQACGEMFASFLGTADQLKKQAPPREIFESVPEGFRFPPRRGKLLTINEKLDLQHETGLELRHNVYRIDSGEGVFGKVYRTRDLTNRIIVIKIFRKDRPTQIIRDQEAFWAVDYLSKKAGIPRRTVRRLHADQNILFLERAYGVTLNDFLKNPKINDEAKEYYRKRYNAMVQALQAEFLEVYSNQGVGTQLNMAPNGTLLLSTGQFGANDQSVHDTALYIKGNNVIIDSYTGELVVIDPY